MEHQFEGSPTKLRDDTWGARIKNTTGVVGKEYWLGEMLGKHILIKTKSGKTWIAEISDVVASFDDATLVRTKSLDRAHGASASHGSYHSGQRRKRLRGYHTQHHCGCGNWGGVGTGCLYSYREAKAEEEAHLIEWREE